MTWWWKWAKIDRSLTWEDKKLFVGERNSIEWRRKRKEKKSRTVRFMQESCSNEADQTCLLCLFYHRPQKTFGGEITNLKFWMPVRKTSLILYIRALVRRPHAAVPQLLWCHHLTVVYFLLIRKESLLWFAKRNEIKICNLQNKLEICNMRNRNVSFAKRKSVIVSRARVQG